MEFERCVRRSCLHVLVQLCISQQTIHDAQTNSTVGAFQFLPEDIEERKRAGNSDKVDQINQGG